MGIDFRDFARQVFALHQRGAFDQALALVDREGPRFPANAETLSYFRMCLLARMGDLEGAVRGFSTALENGGGFSARQLREDEDLAALWPREDFRRLVEVSARQHAERLARVSPEVRVLEPGSAATPARLLCALHGNHSTAAEAEPHWAPATDDGWIVALPESRERVDGAPVWNDRAQAEAQLTAQLGALCAEREVDPQHVVLAGFSRGAELAIWLTLTGAVAARGCVAVAPSPSPVAQYADAIATGRELGVRMALILGEQDEQYLEGGLTLAAALRRGGVACRDTTIPGMGHGFPSAFDADQLPMALAFVIAAGR